MLRLDEEMETMRDVMLGWTKNTARIAGCSLALLTTACAGESEELPSSPESQPSEPAQQVDGRTPVGKR